MTGASDAVTDANPYAAPRSFLSVRLRSSSLSRALWWLQASLVLGLMTTVVSVLFFPASPDINPRENFLRTLSAFPSIVCLCVSCLLLRKSELKLSRVVNLMGLLAFGKLALHILWLITSFSQTVANLTALLFNPFCTYWVMQLLYPALNVTMLLLLVRLASKYGDTRTALFGRLLLVVYTLSMTLHLIRNSLGVHERKAAVRRGNTLDLAVVHMGSLGSENSPCAPGARYGTSARIAQVASGCSERLIVIMNVPLLATHVLVRPTKRRDFGTDFPCRRGRGLGCCQSHHRLSCASPERSGKRFH